MLAALTGQVLAATQPAGVVPPLPSDPWMRLSDLESVAADGHGQVAWVSNGRDSRVSFTPSGARCYRTSVTKHLWSPATGAASIVTLPLQGLVTAQVTVSSGILFLLAPECAGDPGRAALLRADGTLAVTNVPREIFRARMVPLSDNGVAVVTVFGADDSDEQRTRDPGRRHFRAFVIRPAVGRLAVEPMPELPISSRNDYALAAMPGGRLMVLGGSDSGYRGCAPCRQDTYILDPKAKRWQPGPVMREPRSEHHALALPDGGILVTGGWTPDADWGKGPSRTAERWSPETNRFEVIAPMPSGTARHRAVWMAGRPGGTLLIGAGTNSEVQAYDTQTGSWYLAGAAAQGSEEGGCIFVPFLVGGAGYAWAANRSEGFYSSKECFEPWYWQPLRLAASGTVAARPAAIAADGSFVTYQSRAAFLPAWANGPALLIGGTAHAGMNNYLVTAGVTAITEGGTVQALPSLNVARSGALAFRIGGGVLVAHGRGEQGEGHPLPMEWLAAGEPGAGWVRLPHSDVHPSGTLGQAAEGSLVEVDPNSGIARLLTLRFSPSGEPAIESQALPTIGWARRSSGDDEVVRVRGVADGRIVVAGGEIQTDKIALLTPASLSDDGPDEYVGIGPYSPSQRHDIYDPAIKGWRASAPSSGTGGRVAILDDGRVAKISRIPDEGEADPRYVLEISTADGAAWSTVAAEALAPMQLSYSTRPFVVEGELFLAGELESLSTGGGPSGVVWFNSATRGWELLWSAASADNWRDHVGRIIVRQLANGKVVVLPVDGV